MAAARGDPRRRPPSGSVFTIQSSGPGPCRDGLSGGSRTTGVGGSGGGYATRDYDNAARNSALAGSAYAREHLQNDGGGGINAVLFRNCSRDRISNHSKEGLISTTISRDGSRDALDDVRIQTSLSDGEADGAIPTLQNVRAQSKQFVCSEMIAERLNAIHHRRSFVRYVRIDRVWMRKHTSNLRY